MGLCPETLLLPLPANPSLIKEGERETDREREGGRIERRDEKGEVPHFSSCAPSHALRGGFLADPTSGEDPPLQEDQLRDREKGGIEIKVRGRKRKK